MINRRFFVLLLLLIPEMIFSQQYLWPTNASHYLSSSFGEYRPRHFHAGLDIKTWNTTGYKVFAIDDGYIWRIRTSFNGYGKVVYQKLSDGRIAVYAHLDHFIPKIEDLVAQLHQEQGSYDIDYFPQRDDFPLKRGQVIAYTGNTGTRYPHLHFEIRNAKNEPLNPLELGLSVKDRVPPNPQELAIVPLNPGGTVNGSPLTHLSRLTYLGNHAYRTKPITATGTFGIEMKAYDGVSDVYNKYSVYSASLLVDDSLAFKFQYDHFRFSDNALITIERDYALERQGYGRFQRLFKTPFTQHLPFYTSGQTGHLNLLPGKHNLTVELKDYYGNTSTVNIPVNVAAPSEVNSVWQSDSTGMVSCTLTHPDSGTPEKTQLFYAVDAKQGKRLVNPVDTLDTAEFITYRFAPKPNDRAYYLKVQNSAGDLQRLIPHSVMPDTVDQYPLRWHFTENGMVAEINFTRPHYGNFTMDVLSLQVDSTIAFHTRDFQRWTTGHLDPSLFRDAAIFISNQSTGESKAVSENFAVASRNSGTELLAGTHSAKIQLAPRTVYFPGLLWYKVQDGDDSMYSKIYSFYPRTMPFQNTGQVQIALPEVNFPKRQLSIYYSSDDKDWNYLPAEFSADSTRLTGEIFSLESFTLQRDSIPPVIEVDTPVEGSSLSATALKRLEFKVLDEKSGLSGEGSIQLLLDGEPIIFEFNPITKVLIYRVRDQLTQGSHTLQLTAKDAAGNSTMKIVKFTLR